MKKKERMHLCHCRSGKKYKNCCLLKDHPRNISLKKDVVPSIFFRIKSNSDARSSIEIHSASFTANGIKTIVIEDKLTLSVNSIAEDSKTKQQQSVLLNVPVRKNLQSQITTEGNASVVNESNHHDIEPLANKKLIVYTKNGEKAMIKINRQGSGGFDYFDVIFLIGEEHPHITFRPDGNGKYIGLRKFDCELKSTLNYNPVEKTISPSRISIEVKNIIEKLVLNFEFNNDEKTIKLCSANFV